MTTLKPPNGTKGWIALALIVLGGSTGGSYLRPAPPHNPEITTAAWIKMTATVERLDREMVEFRREIREVIRLIPSQPPQKLP